jgi:hypothetical protein
MIFWMITTQIILKSWSRQNSVCPNTSDHWTQRITVVRVHFKELEMAGRDVPNASDHWSQWITLVPIISKIDRGQGGIPVASDHWTQRIKVVWIISKSGKRQDGRPLDAEAVRLLETVIALRCVVVVVAAVVASAIPLPRPPH